MYYQEDLDIYNKHKELKRDILKHKYKNKKFLKCDVKELISYKKSRDTKNNLEISF